MPPRIRPATPTEGMRPPITVVPCTSRVAITSPQRHPGPTLAIFLSSLNVIWFILCVSNKRPCSMLDHPGFGECPPLRTANLTWKKPIILRNFDTSSAVSGWMMQCGSAMQASDLTGLSVVPIIRKLPKRTHQFCSTLVVFRGARSTLDGPRQSSAARQAFSNADGAV